MIGKDNIDTPVVCDWNDYKGFSEELKDREVYKTLKALDERTLYIVENLAPQNYKPFVRNWAIIASAVTTILFFSGLWGILELFGSL